MTLRPIRLLAPVLVTAVLGAAAPGRAAPYLGKRPPGATPAVFAPGVVSTGNIHSRLAISPDGREMFWNTVDMTSFTTRILFVRGRGGVDGAAAAGSCPEGSTQSPVFAPDGKSLFFMVAAEKGWETRLVERLSSGWAIRGAMARASPAARPSRGRAGCTSPRGWRRRRGARGSSRPRSLPTAFPTPRPWIRSSTSPTPSTTRPTLRRMSPSCSSPPTGRSSETRRTCTFT